jgi:hypothetical protein
MSNKKVRFSDEMKTTDGSNIINSDNNQVFDIPVEQKKIEDDKIRFFNQKNKLDDAKKLYLNTLSESYSMLYELHLNSENFFTMVIKNFQQKNAALENENLGLHAKLKTFTKRPNNIVNDDSDDSGDSETKLRKLMKKSDFS